MDFTRGDSYFFKFQRKDFNGKVIMPKAQKMWFTVKENYVSPQILIQKTLDNGITYTPEDGYYHVEIKPSDTRKLEYKKYVCDIQIENSGVVNTIYKDKIKLTKEVTFEGGID